MAATILRLPDVKARTGMSRSAIYASIKKQQFPKPVKLSERSSGWIEAEVSEWIEARIAQSRKAA